MDSPPLTDSDLSSADSDSIPSIHPSDSASNYGGEKEVLPNSEDLYRIPYNLRQTTISSRLFELQMKSNQLTIMFNEESTYQKDRNDEFANARRVEWIARCIEVINDTSKIQVDILDQHLSKHKKRECLNFIAPLVLIEEWLEQIAATWFRTHHQLRLYSFLLNDNNLLDTEALMVDVRRSLCLLIHETFWVVEPPPKVVVLHKQFDTTVGTLLPKALGSMKLKGKASIVEVDQFFRDVQTHKVKPGEFYRLPNVVLENHALTLREDRSSGYIKFKNLSINRFPQRDVQERAFDSKYHLLYQIRIYFPDLDILNCRFTSQSITVVEPNEEATARAFLSDSSDSKVDLKRYSILGSGKQRDIIQFS